MLLGPCPCCGAQPEWDALIQHQFARKALSAAFALPPALQIHIARYLRLFVSPKAPQHVLTPDRYATLLAQLVNDIVEGAIEARGRRWSAPHASWAAAFEAVFAAVADGRRATPLRGHSYLYGVLVNMADQAEAKGERATEQQRQTRPLNPVSDEPATLTASNPVLRNSTTDVRDEGEPSVPREVPAFVAEAIAKLGKGKAMAAAGPVRGARLGFKADDSVLTGQTVPVPPAGERVSFDVPVGRDHPMFGAAVRINHGRFKGLIGSLQRVEGSRVSVLITRPRAGQSTVEFALADVEIDP